MVGDKKKQNCIKNEQCVMKNVIKRGCRYVMINQAKQNYGLNICVYCIVVCFLVTLQFQ